MGKVPWPTLHAGLSSDDIPYGYSAYSDGFDDGRGYEPVAVGHEVDEDGRLVIKVALSPGAYIDVTMALAGQDPDHAREAVVEAVRSLRGLRPSPGGQSSESAQGPPVQGHLPREAHR